MKLHDQSVFNRLTGHDHQHVTLETPLVVGRGRALSGTLEDGLRLIGREPGRVGRLDAVVRGGGAQTLEMRTAFCERIDEAIKAAEPSTSDVLEPRDLLLPPRGRDLEHGVRAECRDDAPAPS